MKLDIVILDDYWEGLYVDNVLYIQNDRIYKEMILDLIAEKIYNKHFSEQFQWKIHYLNLSCMEEELVEVGDFPEKFEDIPKEAFE